MPLACADMISVRLRPQVYPPAGGRAASRAVISTSAIDAASVSMCAASEIRASECAATPATTSPAMKARISARAPHSHLASAPDAGPCACRSVPATI